VEQLIPPEWFIGLHWSVLIGIAAAATYGLMNGADWLVHGASYLARRLGIPKVVVGATIVSLGTTSPECAVSVMAAWNGRPGLALGNAVGSIIADTGLIFGIGCLMAVLPVDRFLLSRQGWVQFGAALLLAGLCYSAFGWQGDAATLGREVGALFLTLLIVYMIMSVRWSRQRLRGLATEPDASVPAPVALPGPADLQYDEDDPAEAAPAAVAPVPEPPPPPTAAVGEAKKASVAWLLSLVVVGAATVVVTSHILIESVSELARQFGVPQVVIAATMVALGTSLPELVVGLTAVRQGHPELLVGNVIGADILNVLFVIGASAVAASLPILDPLARVPHIFLVVHLPTMLTVLILFRVFIWIACRQGHFSRWMGLPLVTLYCAYVVIQYAVS